MGNQKTKVLLCCAYQMVAVGLSRFLSDYNQFQVLTPPTPSMDLMDQISQSSFDILAIDLSLLKHDSLTTLRKIIKTDPALKILILSRNEKEPFITRCMELGATGYISMHCEPIELVEAIEHVNRCEKYLSKDVAYSFALAKINNTDDELSSLTNREFEVFTSLATGLSVKDIAKDLCLSVKTVHVYRANILEKMKVSNTSELTIIALRKGMITIDLVE